MCFDIERVSGEVFRWLALFAFVSGKKHHDFHTRQKNARDSPAEMFWDETGDAVETTKYVKTTATMKYQI